MLPSKHLDALRGGPQLHPPRRHLPDSEGASTAARGAATGRIPAPDGCSVRPCGDPRCPASMRTEFEVDEGCFGLQERGQGEAGEDVVLHEMVAVKAKKDRSSVHVTRRDPFYKSCEWKRLPKTIHQAGMGGTS